MQAWSFEAGSTADNTAGGRSAGDILNVTIITARSYFICSTPVSSAFAHQHSGNSQEHQRIGTNYQEKEKKG